MQVRKVLTWSWILGAEFPKSLHRTALNISCEPWPWAGTEVKEVPFFPPLCCQGEVGYKQRTQTIPSSQCPVLGRENETMSCLLSKPSLPHLFPDLTIALTNPIKFFSLQDKRLVKLKDASGEVSFSRFCSLGHLAWIQLEIMEFSFNSLF